MQNYRNAQSEKPSFTDRREDHIFNNKGLIINSTMLDTILEI